MRGIYDKDTFIQQYLAKVTDVMGKSNKAKILHIPRKQNPKPDLIPKLQSSKALEFNKRVIHETS